jgi:hypothetical protein
MQRQAGLDQAMTAELRSLVGTVADREAGSNLLSALSALSEVDDREDDRRERRHRA